MPFTADDVVFSTKAVLNPANNEVGRDGWDLITKIDEPDKYTVVYHLKKPYAAYASTFFGSAGANPCVCRSICSAKLPNINNAPYNALPVGIGPFKYQSWKRARLGRRWCRTRRTSAGSRSCRRSSSRSSPTATPCSTQLETHEIDLWTPVSPAYYDRAQGDRRDRRSRASRATTSTTSTFRTSIRGSTIRACAARCAWRSIAKRSSRRSGTGSGSSKTIRSRRNNPTFDKSVPTDYVRPRRRRQAAGRRRLDARARRHPREERPQAELRLRDLERYARCRSADRAHPRQLEADRRGVHRPPLPVAADVRAVREQRDRVRRQVGHDHLLLGRRPDRRHLQPVLVRPDPAEGPERSALLRSRL